MTDSPRPKSSPSAALLFGLAAAEPAPVANRKAVFAKNLGDFLRGIPLLDRLLLHQDRKRCLDSIQAFDHGEQEVVDQFAFIDTFFHFLACRVFLQLACNAMYIDRFHGLPLPCLFGQAAAGDFSVGAIGNSGSTSPSS